MKTIILTITFLAAISSNLFSQYKGEALILKNGSTIKGKLLEVSSETYRIRTFDGSILVFPSEEVESYRQTTADSDDDSKNKIGLGMEAGFMVGIQSSQYVAPFGFNIIASYTPFEGQSLSLGGGIEFLGVSFAPVFLEYKADFYNRAATPFFFVRGGAVIYAGGTDEEYNPYYYYGDTREYNGGPTATIGTGINWHRENHDMSLSFGFRYIRTGYSIKDYNSYVSDYTTNWKRLEVKLGFRF